MKIVKNINMDIDIMPGMIPFEAQSGEMGQIFPSMKQTRV